MTKKELENKVESLTKRMEELEKLLITHEKHKTVLDDILCISPVYDFTAYQTYSQSKSFYTIAYKDGRVFSHEDFDRCEESNYFQLLEEALEKMDIIAYGDCEDTDTRRPLYDSVPIYGRIEEVIYKSRDTLIFKGNIQVKY